MRKFISGVVLMAFFMTGITPPSHGQTFLNLPKPGVMIDPRPGFKPARLQGLTLHPDNALVFNFMIDPGDEEHSGETQKNEYNKSSHAIPNV